MRLEITIGEMLAVHAKHAVFTALGAVAGIRHAEVDLGRAILDVEAGPVEPLRSAIRDAVSAAGFEVTAIRELPRTLPTI